MGLTEKEKKEIEEIVETAKILAREDPTGLLLMKDRMETLKTRCDMEKAINGEFELKAV